MRLPRIVIVTIGALLLHAGAAPAQDHGDGTPPSRFASTVKSTLLDPTTYAPAAIMYGSMLLDWKSSQPFFAQGFVEANPRYTLNGLPHDVPISYAAGKRQILMDSLVIVPGMIATNAISHLMERTLIDSHPEHRRLFQVLGVIQRVSLSAFISYRLSSGHFRQWQRNQQLAGQLGYR